MNPARRTFLIGAATTLIAGPAIVRAASLMPVRALAEPGADLWTITWIPTPEAIEYSVFLQQMKDETFNAVMFGTSHPEAYLFDAGAPQNHPSV